MTLVLADTSAIIAAHDTAATEHERADRMLSQSVAIVSPLVLDEVDHLLVARFGKNRLVANLVLDELLTAAEEGAVIVPQVDAADLAVARELIGRYRDLRLDLADAVSVVLAARYRIVDILTLDERDFRAVRPLTPGVAAFRLPVQDGWP